MGTRVMGHVENNHLLPTNVMDKAFVEIILSYFCYYIVLLITLLFYCDGIYYYLLSYMLTVYSQQ